MISSFGIGPLVGESGGWERRVERGTPLPAFPYWQLGFADITIRLLGIDEFPA